MEAYLFIDLLFDSTLTCCLDGQASYERMFVWDTASGNRMHILEYIYIIYIYDRARVKMVEDYFSIAGVLSEILHETLWSDRPPPKAITWDHTRQSIKLGVSQANTVVHNHRTGKTDEGKSTCGALFAVTIAFGIQLARSLSLSFLPYFFLSFLPSFLPSFFLSFFLSLYLSLSLTLPLSLSLSNSLSLTLSLSLSRSVVVWQISFEQCHMLEGLFSDNLSDNYLLHSVPWPSHRAI